MTSVTLTAAFDGEDRRTHLEHLLAEASQGDRAALERFLTLIQQRVLVFAFRLSGNHAAAEDIAQEAMFRVALNLKRYRAGTNLWGWIYRITMRLAYDHHRRKEIAIPLEEACPAGVEDDVERHEQMRRVLDAMKVLTEKERAALVLQDMEGMTCREAADVMRCLQITARTRATHARKKLRAELSRFYPELRGER